MTGLGTIINTAAIAAGGILGHFTGKRFRPEQQAALNTACGVSVILPAPCRECFISTAARWSVGNPCWWCSVWRWVRFSGS